MMFCKSNNVDAYDFPKIGLEKIEQLTETYILSNTETLAPKTLNVVYNAVKTWCFIQKMIKSRKLFREIRFDKQSRKVDAITKRPLETEDVKMAMRICDADEQELIGLYGLVGLRALLITRAKVGDLHLDDYKIENGKLTFTTKNPFLFLSKGYTGNKAKITFFVILPSKLTEIVEYVLNQNDNVTPQTRLMRKY